MTWESCNYFILEDPIISKMYLSCKKHEGGFVGHVGIFIADGATSDNC